MRTLLCFALLAAACGGGDQTCHTARDCAVDQRCVNAVCKGSGDSAGLVGDSCASSGQCGGGLSCDQGFPNGMCTATCDTATCATGVCATLATGATCAATCSTDTDCRQGYGCCSALGFVCVPSAACIAPTCKLPIGTSSFTGSSAAAAPAVVLHEQHKVGDMVSFNVPANTGSVSIVQQAQIANLTVVYKGQVIDNSAVPGIIYKPNGNGTPCTSSGCRAYDDNDPAFGSNSSPDGGTDPSGLYSYYGGDTPVTGAFTFPNTAASLDAGVPAGSWSFQVNDYAYECTQGIGCSDGGASNNTYDVTVLARPKPAGTTVDVNFWIVARVNTNSGQPLNATTAPGDPSVKRMVDTFKGVFSSGGLAVGTVNFYDVSDADAARFGTRINADTTTPCDELDQMFTLSAAQPANALNLFLVQSITSKNNGGGSVVGIDGTIPGPASIAGTIHSGAAVSIADLFHGALNCTGSPDISVCGADEVAFIAAHESGHFMGLFHTTEQDGRDFDPLTDTGKCPCLPCAPSTEQAQCSTGGTASNPVFVKATNCSGAPGSACTGGDNLMFWLLQAPVSAGVVTPQQAAVMKLNPVVH